VTDFPAERCHRPASLTPLLGIGLLDAYSCKSSAS
jgi:hypothetical protein